jgi:hypothetical protein
MDQHALVIVLALVAIGIVVVVGILLARKAKQKSVARLRARFGPEYDRMVSQHGKRRAQKLLEEREERSRKIVVRPLSVESRQRFVQAWRSVQSHFVDTPAKAVMEADHLLEQLMSQRGYSVGDYEQQASDLSVHHPRLVENYRMARVIADSQKRGEATTDDLRQALIQYRVLYEELLGRPISYPTEVKQ